MGAHGGDEALAQAVGLRKQRTEEGRTALVALAEQWPEHAGVAYQTAWAHDVLGLEAEAAPYYERALASEPRLGPDDRYGALLGLGSTYRALGRYAESLSTLRRGLEEFPEDAALRTFLAMTLYNVGESREAVRTLLHVTAETSGDPRIRAYRPAIAGWADNLDEIQ